MKLFNGVLPTLSINKPNNQPQRFGINFQALQADVFVARFGTATTIPVTKYGFDTSLNRTIKGLDNVFETVDLIPQGGKPDQMKESFEVKLKNGQSVVMDSHEYGGLYDLVINTKTGETDATNQANTVELPLKRVTGIYNAFYPTTTTYQANQASIQQMVHVINTNPEVNFANKTLRILDIAAGNGIESDILHQAMQPKGVNFNLHTDAKNIEQQDKINIKFNQDKVTNIELVGVDVEPNAKTSAHRMYGIKNAPGGIESEYTGDNAYFTDYKIAYMSNPKHRQEVASTFKGNEPNVLYCSGSLGLPDHVPAQDFIDSYNLIEQGGLVVINVQDNTLKNAYSSETANGYGTFFKMIEKAGENEDGMPFKVLKNEKMPYRFLLQQVIVDPETKRPDLAKMAKNDVKMMTSRYIILQKKSDINSSLFTSK